MKYKQLLFTATSMMLLTVNAMAQPTIGWSKIYGGDRGEKAMSVKPTPDGGYIATGETFSTPSGDVSERIASKEPDFWVVKLDGSGNIQWEKVYGGYDGNHAKKIVCTKDGGYVLVGTVRESSGDISSSNGHMDMWVLKLNDTGKIEWEKTFGGPDQDEGYDVIQTADGGYAAIGTINTYVMPPGYGRGYNDILVVKLGANGNVEWEKPIGSSSYDQPGSIIQTKDGGYFISGSAAEADGDVTGTHQGDGDWWLVKLDNTGKIEWNKLMGGSRGEFAGKSIQTADEGFIIAGIARSVDGDVVRSSPSATMWDEDIWVVKIDKTGSIVWNKAFGGTLTESEINISNTNDDGAIISGMTSSSDYGMPGDYANRGNDGFLLKIDSDGNLEWTDAYGSTQQDIIYEVVALEDGGYIAAGVASAQDLDIPKHAFGGEKFWILKLDAPAMDSMIVATKGNVPATITTQGGTLELTATIYPKILPQNVTWSITTGTGDATIDANGVVTAVSDGTVWGKAVAVNDNSFVDSIEITISGQTTDPGPGHESVNNIASAKLGISIYPNPAANIINLQVANNHPELKLQMINLDGKIVREMDIAANAMNAPMQLNIANLPAGVYHIKLVGEDVNTGTTIVKQ